MTVSELIKGLTVVALIIEVVHRIVMAIINAIRLMISPEYRAEVWGPETPEEAPT